MQLTRPGDIGLFVLEGRRRKRWSQTDLAERVGASRQWISLVENGKTTVEFKLVFQVLRELGYSVYVTNEEQTLLPRRSDPKNRDPNVPGRTTLTRRGEPLKQTDHTTDTTG